MYVCLPACLLYAAVCMKISYELGEAFLTLHDIKVELMRTRLGSSSGTATSLDPASLKKVDVQKLNEYCRLGVAMFTHFNSFYKTSPNKPSSIVTSSPVNNCEYLALSLEKIDSEACWTPDESELISSKLCRTNWLDNSRIYFEYWLI